MLQGQAINTLRDYQLILLAKPYLSTLFNELLQRSMVTS